MHKKESKLKSIHIAIIAGTILLVYFGLRIATALVDAKDFGIAGMESFQYVMDEIGGNPYHINFLSGAVWATALSIMGIGGVVLAMAYGEHKSAQYKWDAFYEQKRKEGLVRPKGLNVEDDKFAVQSFDEMVGLQSVKQEIKDIIAYYTMQKERKKKGLATSDININMVFYGNPGTGKTVVARYIAKELKKHKVISGGQFVEVDRSIMVGQAPGQTAPLVHEIVDMAIGGVLFIDEAYTLTANRDEYGLEAVNTLLKLMEDYKEDLIVIIAGYDNLMEDFMETNPGLRSRFTKHLRFPDYSPAELLQIFDLTCRKREYACTAEARNKVYAMLERVIGMREQGFSNGRFVRNIFEEIIARQASRTATLPKGSSKAELSMIVDADIDMGKYATDKRDSLKGLEKLIGLDSVKQQVESIINFMKIRQMRKQEGLDVSNVSNHMVFTGNPGTGKTTVARFIAGVLGEMGVLSRGQLVEVDRADIVAEYTGQTAPKTQAVVNSAIGGVLFIDEAYSITPEGDAYGQEAIATLLKMMEDNRDDLIVIVAGYDDLMAQFIDANPGLKSRFNTYLHFPDYNAAELVQIFKHFCSGESYVLGVGMEDALLARFQYEIDNKTKNFANARNARNVYEKALLNQAGRLARLPVATKEDMLTLAVEDIPQ